MHNDQVWWESGQPMTFLLERRRSKVPIIWASVYAVKIGHRGDDHPNIRGDRHAGYVLILGDASTVVRSPAFAANLPTQYGVRYYSIPLFIIKHSHPYSSFEILPSILCTFQFCNSQGLFCFLDESSFPTFSPVLHFFLYRFRPGDGPSWRCR